MTTARGTRRTTSTASTTADHFMVATIAGPGERRLFLGLANYHHDRPDDAPTSTETDPRLSPVYATREAAERGALRFAGFRWAVLPERSAMMDPAAIVGIVEAAGLPGDYDRPRGENFGRFSAEYRGKPDGSVRLTFSDNRNECRVCSLLHIAFHLLERYYRVELEVEKFEAYSLARAVIVKRVIPFADRKV